MLESGERAELQPGCASSARCACRICSCAALAGKSVRVELEVVRCAIGKGTCVKTAVAQPAAVDLPLPRLKAESHELEAGS